MSIVEILPESEEVSSDFELIHKKIADVCMNVRWAEDLGGGETPKEFYDTLRENNEEVNNDE